MDILFRLNFTARDLWLRPEDQLTFDIGGVHEVVVRLYQPSDTDQAKGHQRSNAHSMAQLRMPVSERNEALFAAIEANKVLAEGEENYGAAYDGPDGKRIRIPGLSGFPVSFQDFVKGAYKELVDYTRRTVLVLRWRTDSEGPHNPFSTRGMEWSRDGGFWHPARATPMSEARYGEPCASLRPSWSRYINWLTAERASPSITRCCARHGMSATRIPVVH